MNSERNRRKALVQVLTNALTAQESANTQGTEISEALRSAIEINSQPPRSGTPCELTLRVWHESMTTNKADCSECGAMLLGYESFWKYAPCCGASIVKVNREADPRQRLERTAIKNAVGELTAVTGGR